MKYTCSNCGSLGFEPSKIEGLCTYCDGTVGGNPPKKDESEK